MKIGIILFVIGSILALYLSKFKFKKKYLTNIGLSLGIFFIMYGIILMIQPNDEDFVKFTKTTISKDLNSTNK